MCRSHQQEWNLFYYSFPFHCISSHYHIDHLEVFQCWLFIEIKYLGAELIKENYLTKYIICKDSNKIKFLFINQSYLAVQLEVL